MASVKSLGKEWSRNRGKFFLNLLRNLRSQLTWREVLIGLLASVILSSILVGFLHRAIPEFEIGEVARQEIRAPIDLQYVDEEMTALKRSEAMKSVPAVYDLNQGRIFEINRAVRNTFEIARSFLEENASRLKGAIGSDKQKTLISELKKLEGGNLPDDVVSLLLRENFDAEIESNILNNISTVLSDGIVEDGERFDNEQRTGIVIRDGSIPTGLPLSDTNLVRDLPEARKYLRQMDLDLPKMAEGDKETLLRYLESLLVPTLFFNESETEARRELAASQVPPVVVQIRGGQTLVPYGTPITPKLLSQLNAIRNLWKPSSIIPRGLGYFLFAVVLLYALWRYLILFKARRSVIRKQATLILVIITAELLVIRLLSGLADILDERFDWFQDPSRLYYAIPFALGPLLVALLADGNLGVMVSVILATLTGLFYGDVYIAVYLIMGSLAGIYSIRQYKDRAAILKAGFAIWVLNCICFTGLSVLRQNPVSLAEAMDLAILAFISGILASTIASMMLPALEYFFKIVTDIRLLELSNLNDPILRRLSVEAPGTYHHSLMVATLAENAAEAIGANPLLVRVSAYYHDIGKIVKPEYFVENQSVDHNKHEQISPRMSSLVLARHVKDGLQLAKEIGLPQQIKDMIPQHHGTRMMSYFFQKAKERGDMRNGAVSETDFRYAGPKPQSREAAIMMMADSVEAASRTLSSPNSSQVKGLIDRLVDGIVSEDQFDECNITLKDIRLVKESFFKILAGYFHRRIDYPNYDFSQSGENAERRGIQNSDTKQAKTL